MMASNSNQDVEQPGNILDCAICLERLKVPKYLPCLHTFCESCLQTYIDSTTDNQNHTKCFSCPMCRLSIEGTQETNTESWASMFPFNHTISHLLDSMKEKDKKSITHCDPCRRGGDQVEATKWCINCLDYFCETCEGFHSKIKATIDHKVVSVYEKKSITHEPIEIVEPCREHRGKNIEVLCEDHNKMCCVMCLAVDHRLCKNIKSIDEVVEFFDDRTLNIAEAQRVVCTVFEKIISEKQANIEAIISKKDELIKIVNVHVKSVIKMLKSFQTNSDERLNKLCLAENESSQTELEDLNRQKLSILQFIQFDELLRLHGTKMQRFFNRQKLILTLNNAITDLKGKNTRFQERDIFKNALAEDEFSTLNAEFDKFCDIDFELKTSKSQCLHTVVSKLGRVLSEVICVRKEFKDVNLLKVFSAKAWNGDDENSPWLTGGCFVSNHICIFADRTNRKLKVINISSDGTIVKEHKFDYRPVDIKTRHETSELYVSTEIKSINIFQLDDQFNVSFIRSIGINKEVWGFDLRQNSFYVHLCVPGEVVELNSAGCKTIASSYEITNGYVFCDQDSGDVISSKGHHVLRISDNSVAEFRNEILSGSRGVTCDRNGNIYVCGVDSENIILLSANLIEYRQLQLIDSRIRKPYTIGFDIIGRRLFVTSHCEDISFEIYELS